MLFFMLVIIYSFIIGADKTIKILIGSYVSLLVADWVWNMFKIFSDWAFPIVGLTPIVYTDIELITYKIIVFIILIVVFGTRWKFDSDVTVGLSWAKSTLVTFIFAFLSAWVILAALFILSSWWTLLTKDVNQNMSENYSIIYASSYLMQLIKLNANLIFALPIILYLALSMRNHEEWGELAHGWHEEEG